MLFTKQQNGAIDAALQTHKVNEQRVCTFIAHDSLRSGRRLPPATRCAQPTRPGQARPDRAKSHRMAAPWSVYKYRQHAGGYWQSSWGIHRICRCISMHFRCCRRESKSVFHQTCPSVFTASDYLSCGTHSCGCR